MIVVFAIAAQATQQGSTDVVRLVLAVLCVMVLSSVALGASLGLARRMHQIADRESPAPSDEQEPDSSEDIPRE